jgi:hypothetical protein
MSKAHNPLGKITSLCCPKLGIFFVFNICTGTRVALINPVGELLQFFEGRLKLWYRNNQENNPARFLFAAGKLSPFPASGGLTTDNILIQKNYGSVGRRRSLPAPGAAWLHDSS